MSAKDLIQELQAACYNNNYRQNYGTWEACVTATADNYEIQEEGNYAGSENAIKVIEGLGIAAVTIMGVMCTVQIYQGRQGLWQQFTNGITLIVEGVQYAINVVTRNRAENDVENQSSRSGSSNELNLTPIRPRIIHYPPADAQPQPLIRPTTQTPPIQAPQIQPQPIQPPTTQTPPIQAPQIQPQPIQPPPIQPQPIQPPPITPPAQVDDNDREQDNAPLTMPNTPSPTFSRTTIKPDTDIEADKDIETTNEEAHDITIVPIQSKIIFKN